MLHVFQDRILNDLLPMFCTSRSWSSDGFKPAWDKISEVDIVDFLRGIDGELVKHEGRALYKAARSYAGEQFFWSGSKRKKNPRPITLWVEPIITVAVLARLHFDLGWPKELLGTQTKDWAFDVATYLSNDSDAQYIACEVKKSIAELNKLLELMAQFGKCPPADQILAPNERNAFRKVKALWSYRPPLFWAIGPGGSSHAFRVDYSEKIGFQEIEIQELDYLSAKSRGG